jgi:hypothetical protein
MVNGMLNRLIIVGKLGNAAFWRSKSGGGSNGKLLGASSTIEDLCGPKLANKIWKKPN